MPHVGGLRVTVCGPLTVHPPVLSPLTGNKSGEWSGQLSLSNTQLFSYSNSHLSQKLQFFENICILA